jgi:cytochrome c553
MLVRALALTLVPLSMFAQRASGPQLFRANCAGCHGDDAKGGAQGPGLALNPRVAEQTAAQLRVFLQHGNPGAGMPAFADLSEGDRSALASYLRSLNADTILRPTAEATSQRVVKWNDPQPGDWLTYNGSDSGNRYSPLKQITAANVSSLKPKWVYPIEYFGLETTPLEASGTMYVTGPNQVIALDALTGEAIWRYSRPATPGLVGDPKLGTNRGVAILRDRVYFVTDNARLLGLDRATGKLMWETPLAPNSPQPYGATIAPLIVGNKSPGRPAIPG